jgi:hypothetical protein
MFEITLWDKAPLYNVNLDVWRKQVVKLHAKSAQVKPIALGKEFCRSLLSGKQCLLSHSGTTTDWDQTGMLTARPGRLPHLETYIQQLHL